MMIQAIKRFPMAWEKICVYTIAYGLFIKTEDRLTNSKQWATHAGQVS
jgi:hypothetical protein